MTILWLLVGVGIGLVLAWLVEWLLDWRFRRREVGMDGVILREMQGALAAADAELVALRAELAALRGETGPPAG